MKSNHYRTFLGIGVACAAALLVTACGNNAPPSPTVPGGQSVGALRQAIEEKCRWQAESEDLRTLIASNGPSATYAQEICNAVGGRSGRIIVQLYGININGEKFAE